MLKSLFALVTFLVALNSTLAQNRMYLALHGGAAFGIEERGSNYGIGPAFGLTYLSESRITGNIYSLIGLGVESITNKQREYVFSNSTVKQTQLNIPLMLRFNTANMNKVYFDVGFMPSYILICNLSEGMGIIESRNVAPDMSRFRLAFQLASTYSFGRFNVGWACTYKITDVNAGSLEGSWPLGSISPFLENAGNSHGAVLSLTTSYRIK